MAKRLAPLAAAAIAAGVLTLTACSSSGGSSPQSSTPPATTASSSVSPASATQPASNGQGSTLSGTFSGLNGKKVSGSAQVSAASIVLSNFSSDQGPDLHIYLTNGTDEAAVMAGKEISKVAYNQASQTFTLTGVDVSQYDTVVIHCDKAKAVFGAAPIS